MGAPESTEQLITFCPQKKRPDVMETCLKKHMAPVSHTPAHAQTPGDGRTVLWDLGAGLSFAFAVYAAPCKRVH